MRALVGTSGAASSGYTVLNSVYGDGSTGYFSRTPGSAATSNKKWDFSFWVKPSAINSGQCDTLYSGAVSGSHTSGDGFHINSDYDGSVLRLRIACNNDAGIIHTSAAIRDPDAWMHIYIKFDTTQATATDRVRWWFNGVENTATISRTNPALDATLYFGTSGQEQRILLRTTGYSRAYIAEFFAIDGGGTAVSNFGETDSTTGSWKPKSYDGTYGTNGFYLPFTNSGSLGTDSSGNGNNFTKNGTITQTTDSPTDKAASNVGNFATINVLGHHYPATITISDGNLKATWSNDAYRLATIGVSSGKWYWEQKAVTWGGLYTHWAGIAQDITTTFVNEVTYSGYNGVVSGVGTGGEGTFASWSVNDVIGCAFDADAGTLAFYKNNSLITTVTGIPAGLYFPMCSGNGGVALYNFGQTSFAYTPPTGFKRLCTANLAAPTVKKPSSHFAIVTYTGNATNGRQITGVGFQPDFVWVKRRDGGAHHILVDAIRGADNYIASSSANAEASSSGISSFDADGFTLAHPATGDLNASGATYVAWCWKAGNSSGSSNTSGSITSTVSANTTAGMSIVKWTGTAANATVGHGLGAVPKFIITKANTQVTEWPVYHASLANTEYVVLNTTAAKATGATYWNSTTPTSTVFSLGSSTNTNNTNGMIAYCFAEVSGFSKFGSYTGNGSADGPFVWCGFRPKWLLIKGATSAGDWRLIDTARDTYNDGTPTFLYPSLTLGDDASGLVIDVLSNGFKVRSATYINVSSNTYIFAAFAEFPFGGTSTTQGKAR
jgi:hypothetical protein